MEEVGRRRMPKPRVGVREFKKANALIIFPPHPRLLPEGEGVRAFCDTLPQGEGHDCKDAGGRAKQEARAEDEGVIEIIVLAVLTPLTPTLGFGILRRPTSSIPGVVSLRERELTGQQ